MNVSQNLKNLRPLSVSGLKSELVAERQPLPSRSITCPVCGMTSHNQEDVKHRYCGNCHQSINTLQIGNDFVPFYHGAFYIGIEHVIKKILTDYLQRDPVSEDAKRGELVYYSGVPDKYGIKMDDQWLGVIFVGGWNRLKMGEEKWCEFSFVPGATMETQNPLIERA